MLAPIITALFVAGAIAAVWLGTRRSGPLYLAASWLAYAIYEYLMYVRVLCTGECNIRVDLLLIYPLLIGATVVVLGATIVRAIKSRREG